MELTTEPTAFPTHMANMTAQIQGLAELVQQLQTDLADTMAVVATLVARPSIQANHPPLPPPTPPAPPPPPPPPHRPSGPPGPTWKAPSTPKKSLFPSLVGAKTPLPTGRLSPTRQSSRPPSSSPATPRSTAKSSSTWPLPSATASPTTPSIRQLTPSLSLPKSRSS